MIAEPIQSPPSQKKKLAVCIPIYNTDCKIYFALSLAQTQWPENTEIMFLQGMGMLTPNACKQFVDASQKWGADHMMIVSVDVGWKPDAVIRLLAHNKPVVSGWASGRTSPFRCHAANEIDVEKGKFKPVSDPENHHGLEQVKAVGGELTIYNMDVFKDIPSPWFFGPETVATGRQMSEDYFFALQAHKHGVDIYCDWDVQLRHCVDGLTTIGGKLVAM